MFFFLVIEMLGCMVAGPEDTDLQHRIMNSAGILVCYVMKTQPHARPNLQLDIFEILPDIVSRHIKMF